MLENIKNILAIDSSETKNNKKKEPDQISTSSSATNTNFTGEFLVELKIFLLD